MRTPRAADLARLLAHGDADVRSAAVLALGRLEVRHLAPHTALLAERLADSDVSVRRAAARALACLEARHLAPHAAALAERLADGDAEVRGAAAQALECFEPRDRAATLALLLADGDARVREAALGALRCVGPQALQHHVVALVERLADSDDRVRWAALHALGGLEPWELQPHAAALVQHLADRNACVWVAALRALGSTALAERPAPAPSQSLRVDAAIPHQDPAAAPAECPAPAPSQSLRVDAAIPPQDPDAAPAECPANGDAGWRWDAFFTEGRPQRLRHGDTLVFERMQEVDAGVQEAALAAQRRLDPQVFPAALVECLWDAETRVRTAASRLLQTLLRTSAGRTATLQTLSGSKNVLHRAAANGDLELVRSLVEAGLSVKQRDESGRSAEDRARSRGHAAVAGYLRRCTPVAAARVGAGDAFDQAMGDRRPVRWVEWYTVPLEEIGWLKGCHSLLAITVASPEDPSNRHVYVMEKAASGQQHVEQFRQGVFISHWRDVKGSMDSQYASLSPDHIRAGVTMRALRDLAVAKGPYKVGSNNCHHAALLIFNACAKERYRRSRRPKRAHTAVAWFLGLFGVDIGASRSRLSKSAGRGADVQIVWQSDTHDPYPFPLEGSCAPEEHREAKDAAILAVWIHEPARFALGSAFLVDAMHESTLEDPVQRSLVQKEGTYYCVFRGADLGGADSLHDILVGINCMPTTTESGLKVHGSMWAALQQGALQSLHRCADPAAEMVVCGYSLGGGYAILAALDLLRAGVEGVRVITFGAPQVVVPDPENEVWRALSARTRNYVNAWDMIPRLPSSRPWVDITPKLFCKSSAGISRVQHVVGRGIDLEQLTAYGLHYEHVGTVIFVKKGSRESTKRQSQEEDLRSLLGTLPSGYDQDAHLPKLVMGYHDCAEYKNILKLVAERDD